MTTKAVIAVAFLFLLPICPSFGQAVHDDGPLQQILSGLRTCVRSNAAEAYALGIRAAADAEEFFAKRCHDTILGELARSKATVIPPGRFRVTMRDEWAAFLDGRNGK